jgi:hypothetical protein
VDVALLAVGAAAVLVGPLHHQLRTYVVVHLRSPGVAALAVILIVW